VQSSALLHELSERERDLLESKVYLATGSMEDKCQQLADAGVFQAYEAIHRTYANAVSGTPSGLEALKRALFLGWYAPLRSPLASPASFPSTPPRRQPCSPPSAESCARVGMTTN
jgi:hypothetical protein